MNLSTSTSAIEILRLLWSFSAIDFASDADRRFFSSFKEKSDFPFLGTQLVEKNSKELKTGTVLPGTGMPPRISYPKLSILFLYTV